MKKTKMSSYQLTIEISNSGVKAELPPVRCHNLKIILLVKRALEASSQKVLLSELPYYPVIEEQPFLFSNL